MTCTFSPVGFETLTSSCRRTTLEGCTSDERRSGVIRSMQTRGFDGTGMTTLSSAGQPCDPDAEDVAALPLSIASHDASEHCWLSSKS